MNARLEMLRENLRGWPARRWLVAVATAIATSLVVAITTDLIDTPVLAGLLTATYVARPESTGSETTVRLGSAGAIISFLAVPARMPARFELPAASTRAHCPKRKISARSAQTRCLRRAAA